MFGHQDENNDDHHHDDQPVDNVLSGDQAAALGNEEEFNPALPAPTELPSISYRPPADSHHGDDNNGEEQQNTEEPASAPAVPTTQTSDDHAAAQAGQATDDHDLIAIKQQALNLLSPLIDHLDQTPEEKFRTTMMMIQAADNQALIKTAYDAAQAISDEKTKAQALLDIVNEINYFSQKTK